MMAKTGNDKTLFMHCLPSFHDFETTLAKEKYEQGIEQGNKQAALRMIEAGKLSYEEIAMYSGLTLEQVLELQKEVQLV